MLKGDIINGYKILKDFSTAGGGLSKWSFAQKGEREFFIKEFLAPKYPTPDAPGSEQSKEKKRLACQKFESHHKALMKQVNEKCGTGGNLVFTVDFFRQHSKYYKITEKVDVATLTVKEIASLPLENRVMILKTIAHSLNVLHKADIVHGDLKPDNVLIKQTKTNAYTSKLIDFDNSYFTGHPPEIVDDLVGDMVFYSPELACYIKKDERVKPQNLTTQSDIFALGLLYCLYLTGELPAFDKDTYNYACMAVLAGNSLELKAEKLPPTLIELVNQMLLLAYEQRPAVDEVFETLKNIDLTDFIDTEEKSILLKTGLKGGLIAIKKEDLPTLKSTSSSPVAKPDKTAEPDQPTTSGLRGKGLGINKK